MESYEDCHFLQCGAVYSSRSVTTFKRRQTFHRHILEDGNFQYLNPTTNFFASVLQFHRVLSDNSCYSTCNAANFRIRLIVSIIRIRT